MTSVARQYRYQIPKCQIPFPLFELRLRIALLVLCLNMTGYTVLMCTYFAACEKRICIDGLLFPTAVSRQKTLGEQGRIAWAGWTVGEQLTSRVLIRKRLRPSLGVWKGRYCRLKVIFWTLGIFKCSTFIDMERYLSDRGILYFFSLDIQSTLAPQP
jgi:hypothetical protein